MTGGTRRGWLLAGQVLLAAAAAFSLPLGARDGGGVSSILPPLRAAVPGVEAATSARSERRGVGGAGQRHAESRRVVRRRRRPGRPTGPSLLRRRPPGDDAPSSRPAGTGQSRAPPPVR